MQPKNGLKYGKEIIIFLLTISNLLLLYYQYKNSGIDCFSASKNISDVISEQQIAFMKQRLLETYDATQHSCGAAVSLHKRNNLAGTDLLDMACLIAGNRDVIWVTMDTVKADLDNQCLMFKAVAQAEGIREFEGVSFRPSGERNAVLFTKAWLTMRTSHKLSGEVQQIGASYLLGLLLGYDTHDIAFFYQRSDFMGHLPNDVMPPFTYPEFSDELKQQFSQYLEHEWISSGRRDRFEDDKQQALKWVEDQSQYSIEQLYEQIKKLKQ